MSRSAGSPSSTQTTCAQRAVRHGLRRGQLLDQPQKKLNAYVEQQGLDAPLRLSPAGLPGAADLFEPGEGGPLGDGRR